MKRILLLILLALLWPSFSSAGLIMRKVTADVEPIPTYTVCPNPPGTCDQLDIQAAVVAYDLEPDDFIKVYAGTYTTMVDTANTDTGTSGHPILIQSHSGDTVTVDTGGATDGIVLDAGVDFLILDGIDSTTAPRYGLSLATGGSTGIIIRNFDISSNVKSNIVATSQDDLTIENGNASSSVDEDGIRLQLDCTGDLVIDSVTIDSNDDNGIEFNANDLEAFGAGAQVIDCTISENSGLGGVYIAAGYSAPVIHCTFDGNNGDGFHLLGTALSGVIRRSTIFDSGTVGGSSTGDGVTNHGTAAGLEATHCLMYNNGKFAVALASSSTAIITNCTIYNNQQNYVGGEYLASGAVGASPMVNCIVVNTESRVLVKTDQWATLAGSDYNCYYGNAANPFNVADTNYATFALYKAAGQAALSDATFESHSMWADPVFVTPGSDFHLQSGSPCRDAGLDVSLTVDLDGVAIPQETNPAIGAFEYVAP